MWTGFSSSILGIAVGMLLWTQSSQGASQAEIFARFKECISRCSKIDDECNQGISDLWMDYFKNKRKILKHLRKCCLKNEHLEYTSPDDSFATCARLNCNAMLWGWVRFLIYWVCLNENSIECKCTQALNVVLLTWILWVAGVHLFLL